ncbi:MAG: energy transducer TonB, partial [Rubrivivax sp.]
IELREPPPAPTITVQAAAAPVTTPAPPAPAITPPPPAPPLPSILKVSAGSLRYLVEPALEVPRISRRLGELGTVTLRVVVDARGQPREVLLLHSSGFERLDQQALGAMRRARFVPCSQDGKPVECVFDAPIEYTLEN